MKSIVARVAAVAALCVGLVACGGMSPPPARAVDAPTIRSPSATCSADVAVPQILATQAAVLPDATWQQHTAFQARVRFRVDEDGVPQMIRATVLESDREALASAATNALAAYRFCHPIRFSPRTDWNALIIFGYRRLPDGTGVPEIFTQQFSPGYTGSDIGQRRAGNNRVRGTFGPDGKPISFALSATSGDPVLDDKSLESMASMQLIFPPGTGFGRPITFEQAFRYEIR